MSFALRSHRAVSTAAMAIEEMPGRPKLRMARTIDDQARGTSMASRPTTDLVKTSSMSRAQAPVA